MVHKRTNRRKTLKGGRRTRRKSRKRLAKTRRGLRSKKRKRRRKSRKSRRRRGGLFGPKTPEQLKASIIKSIDNLKLPDGPAARNTSKFDNWYNKHHKNIATLDAANKKAVKHALATKISRTPGINTQAMYFNSLIPNIYKANYSFVDSLKNTFKELGHNVDSFQPIDWSDDR